MAKLVIAETSSRTITVAVTELDIAYKYVRYYYWYLDGVYKAKTSTAAHATRAAYTFSNLTPGTRYTVSVEIYGAHLASSGESETYLTSFSEDTGTNEEPIELWTWTASNGSATATETRVAYTAITSKGFLSNFSYKVWNDMCDKINELFSKTGRSWNGSWMSLASTKMSSSSKTLTANRFNSLNTNIGYKYGTGIANVKTGDPVLGEYFIILADVLNKSIDYETT